MPTAPPVDRLTPNTRRYTTEGRIGRLIVRGAKVKANVVRAITDATLDLSTGGVTQLTLTLSDPDLDLLGSRLFTPGDDTRAGSRVEYLDLDLEVAAVEHDGTTLTVTARSLGAQQLRRRRGKLVRRGLSPTQFAALEAKAVGLKFVGEPSAKRKSIVRKAGDEPETSWDTIGRLAQELGYLTFESAGVLYFGRPTWLADRAERRLRVAWKGERTDPRVLGMPKCRRTGDGASARLATVDLEVTGELGDDVRPGHRFTLDGVPTFEGRYLVDGVTIPLADGQPVSIKASSPVNPTPQPPDVDSPEARAGHVSVPAPRPSLKIKGQPASRDQLANATTIYRVGRAMGIPTYGIRIALAVAIQESVLRNLNYGDRDSLGLFQQRASWGSAEDRRTPEKAARLFYNALKRVPGWESLTLTAAAQAVQRSATPGAYAQWSTEAGQLVDAIVATIPKTPTGGDRSSTPGGGGGYRTAGAFVRVALAQAGDSYIYGAEAAASNPNPSAFDCSELVEWALARVGVTFVDGSSAQIARCRPISVEQAIRTRGALLWHPGHIAISLGNGRTIEAANSRVGVVSYSAAGRFSRGGLVPGLAY